MGPSPLTLPLRALLNLFAPHACAACDAPVAGRAWFCVPCAASLERVAPRDRRASPSTGPRAAFVYGGAIAETVRRFKYRDRPDLASALAAVAIDGLDRLDGAAVDVVSVDAIVALPSHPRRVRARGFDHVALLARAIADRLLLPIKFGRLERVADTRRLAGMSAAARREEVRSAFVATALRGDRGSHVLLVDDVCTTGATMRAAVEALARCGVHATGLVVAQTERIDDST